MFENLPKTSTEVFDRMQADFQNALPESNPFLKGSYLNSLIKASAMSIFDWYKALEQQTKFLFPSTSTGDMATVWGQLQGIEQGVASASTGTMSIGGLSGTSIPQNALFNGSNGVEYSVQNSVQITTKVNAVTGISKIGLIVTVDLEDVHNLNDNISVTISGADVSVYNGTFAITVTAQNSFTYEIPSDDTLPSIASMNAVYTTAALELVSETFGSATNLELNAVMNIQQPLAGVNTSGGVDFLGLTGGSDDESIEDFRVRYLNAWKNPRTPLNVADIEFRAFSVPGVTRVWVKEIYPAVGQVSTYFVRDGDADILPSAGEITNVKNEILLSKTAFIDEADIIVEAPTGLTIDFTFTSIVPNTPTMQQAISNNLDVFFKDHSNLGEDIQEISYQKAISESIDLETGDVLTSFTLSTPTGDITVATEELAILGDITFV